MLTQLFITWDIDPVLFHLGSFEVRYYSLCWMAAFLLGIWIMNKMLRKEGVDTKLTDSIFIYTFISTVIGARLGHCLFYEPGYYLSHPWEMLYIWQGGLASHGAAVGMFIGLWLLARKKHLPLMWLLDRMAVVIPIGGAMVRLGNLFNSEIYGTETDLPWGFVFTLRGETVAMHPTQIYEALIYTAIFLLLLWLFFRKDIAQRYPGFLFGLFLILLFGGRFFIEMIKNVQVDFEQDMALNMGQILSIPFVLAGVAILILALKKRFHLVNTKQPTHKK